MSSYEYSEASVILLVLGILLITTIADEISRRGIRPMTPEELEEQRRRERNESVAKGLQAWLEACRRKK